MSSIWNSATFTSTAGTYYVVSVTDNTGVVDWPTIASSNNITFTPLIVAGPGGGVALYIWGGFCSKAASGYIQVIDYGTIIGAHYDSFAGIDTASPVVQILNGAGYSFGLTTFGITLAALQTNSLVYVAGLSEDGNAISLEVDYTTTYNNSGYSVVGGIVTGYKSPGTTNPYIVVSADTNNALVGIELRHIDLVQYLVYDSTTGKIKSTGTCNYSLVSLQAQAGETAIVGVADPITQYIDVANVVIISRPTFTSNNTWNVTSITSNGANAAVFGSNLANPTTVRISPLPTTGVLSTAATITTGNLTLTTTGLPGTYSLLFQSFPYQDYTVTITGT